MRASTTSTAITLNKWKLRPAMEAYQWKPCEDGNKSSLASDPPRLDADFTISCDVSIESARMVLAISFVSRQKHQNRHLLTYSWKEPILTFQSRFLVADPV